MIKYFHEYLADNAYFFHASESGKIFILRTRSNVAISNSRCRLINNLLDYLLVRNNPTTWKLHCSRCLIIFIHLNERFTDDSQRLYSVKIEALGARVSDTQFNFPSKNKIPFSISSTLHKTIYRSNNLDS